MNKGLMIGIAVAIVAAAVAGYLLTRDPEAKAASRLQECWEQRKREPARKCMAETEVFLAACQKSAARQACVEKVTQILNPRR